MSFGESGSLFYFLSLVVINDTTVIKVTVFAVLSVVGAMNA